jgi:hypothetical protein
MRDVGVLSLYATSQIRDVGERRRHLDPFVGKPDGTTDSQLSRISSRNPYSTADERAFRVDQLH